MQEPCDPREFLRRQRGDDLPQPREERAERRVDLALPACRMPQHPRRRSKGAPTNRHPRAFDATNMPGQTNTVPYFKPASTQAPGQDLAELGYHLVRWCGSSNKDGGLNAANRTGRARRTSGDGRGNGRILGIAVAVVVGVALLAPVASAADLILNLRARRAPAPRRPPARSSPVSWWEASCSSTTPDTPATHERQRILAAPRITTGSASSRANRPRLRRSPHPTQQLGL